MRLLGRRGGQRNAWEVEDCDFQDSRLLDEARSGRKEGERLDDWEKWWLVKEKVVGVELV